MVFSIFTGVTPSPNFVVFVWFLFILKYLFIYLFGCVGSLLWRAGFSLVVACGFSLSSCGAGCRAHRVCSLWHMGSLVEAHELSSCGAQV